MLILVNLFLPHQNFYDTNVATLTYFLDQWKVLSSQIKLNYRVYIIGYVHRDFLHQIKTLVLTDIVFDVTDDYSQVKSKCQLLNRYFTPSALANGIFYFEYDIQIPNMFDKLGECPLPLSPLPWERPGELGERQWMRPGELDERRGKHPGEHPGELGELGEHQGELGENQGEHLGEPLREGVMGPRMLQGVLPQERSHFWALMTDRHQPTIYETIEKTGLTSRLARPFDKSINAIGSGCFYLNIVSCLDKIICPSYGYGDDDGHICDWLLKMNVDRGVLIDWRVNHFPIEDELFEGWKRNVITKQPLTKEEYDDFWVDYHLRYG